MEQKHSRTLHTTLLCEDSRTMQGRFVRNLSLIALAALDV
jgi:hypothetical protein